MKKRLLMLLCLTLMAGGAAWANIASGRWNNGYWSIDDKGTLFVNVNHVSSDFKMPDWGEGKAPWYKYAEQIRAIRIGSNCRNVGRNAFYGLVNVEKVTGGENVEAVAMYAFEYCGGGKGNNRIAPIPVISFPKCTYVGENAFHKTSASCLSLPMVETFKDDAVNGSCHCYNFYDKIVFERTRDFIEFIDLGSKVKKLKAGSVTGPDYVFIQNPTPPDWERLYDKNASESLQDDMYKYPFGDNHDVKVIVPQEYLQTYIEYYPSKHPEVENGYMCARYPIVAWTYHKNSAVFPAGKLVAGGPIYEDGQPLGGWYKEDSQLNIVMASNIFPYFGDNAPWKDVLGSVTSMRIKYLSQESYTDTPTFIIPDYCFNSGTKASASIRGIKELYFEGIEYLYIGKDAFAYCNELKEVNYVRPDDDNRVLTCQVSDNAFYKCTSLTSLHDLDINYVGASAFYGCTKLASPYCDWSLSAYEVHESAFEGCTNLKTFDLSKTSFIIINDNAFKATGLKEVCLNSCYKVCENAFAGSDIQKIEFGRSTIDCGFQSRCFADCNQLSDIFVSSYIGSDFPLDIFDNVTLSDITLHVEPDLYGRDYEHHAIFGQMKVDKLFCFPQGDSSKGWEIVDGVADKELHQATLRIYKTFSFDNPARQPWHNFREYIKLIDIADNVSCIGSNEFAGLENVVTVSLPYNCKTIQDNAFRNCPNLRNISITGVETLGNCVFEDCSSLESIDLGTRLKKAGDYIFRRCYKLNYIGNKDSTPAEVTQQTFAEIGSDVYHAPRPGGRDKAASNNGQSNVTLKVPDEYVTNYIIDPHWGKFHIKFADSRGTWEHAGPFGDGTWILYDDSTMVVAADKGPGENQENWSWSALRFNDEVMRMTKRIEFSGNLKYIAGCFQFFENLESVVLSPSIKTLSGTFADCPKLYGINLDNVTTLGENTFSNTGLTSIDLSNVKPACLSVFYTAQRNRGCISFFYFRSHSHYIWFSQYP